MTTQWQVRAGGSADLDLVGPLWVAVHHQHSETMPQLAPYVSDDETWRVRRGYQPTWLYLSRFEGR